YSSFSDRRDAFVAASRPNLPTAGPNSALMRQTRRLGLPLTMARFSGTFSRTRIQMVAELLLANLAVIRQKLLPIPRPEHTTAAARRSARSAKSHGTGQFKGKRLSCPGTPSPRPASGLGPATRPERV